jgi:hypothetical protein
MVMVIDAVATITIDESGAISVSPDPITTIPGKHIVFLIKNDHSHDHHVSVNPFNFQTRNGTDPGSPDKPINVFVKFFDDVPAGDVGAFVLGVRDKDEFGGEPSGRVFKYKYTIKASDLPDKDPDIDINN